MELKAPKIRRFILKTLLPITKWIGTVSFPYTRRIKDVDVIAMEAVLKPGMVLGSYARGHASNLVIPGRLKHIAIYRGVVGGVHTVIEALGPGVQTSDFVDFAFGKDLIYIFNPLFATPEILWETPTTFWSNTAPTLPSTRLFTALRSPGGVMIEPWRAQASKAPSPHARQWG
jgi:hypothetical protein